MEKINVYGVLMVNPERKRPFGRPGLLWQSNIS